MRTLAYGMADLRMRGCCLAFGAEAFTRFSEHFAFVVQTASVSYLSSAKSRIALSRQRKFGASCLLMSTTTSVATSSGRPPVTVSASSRPPVTVSASSHLSASTTPSGAPTLAASPSPVLLDQIAAHMVQSLLRSAATLGDSPGDSASSSTDVPAAGSASVMSLPCLSYRLAGYVYMYLSAWIS